MNLACVGSKDETFLAFCSWKIRELFDRHKGRYGYRRITAAIRRSGDLVNHKTVRRLLVQLQLRCLARVKKYRSYKGQLGHVALNDLARQFYADRPNEKWYQAVRSCRGPGLRRNRHT